MLTKTLNLEKFQNMLRYLLELDMNTVGEIQQKLDQLLFDNYSKLDTPGLFKGKMGVCLYLFESYQKNNEPKYLQAAESILQELYTFIHQNPIPTYFDNGLVGIAWGINQLIKRGFLEGKADEVLAQIDNILFKVISEKFEEFEFGLKRGLLGYLLYVLDRLSGIPDQQELRISREIFISLATLLINHLHLMVESGKASFIEPAGFHLFWDFPNYLYLMAEANKLALLPEKLKQMVKDITPLVLSYVPRNPGNSLNLFWTIKRLCVPDWESQACLLKNRIFDSSLSRFEFHNKALYVEHGLAGLILLDAQVNAEISDYPRIFENDENLQAALFHVEGSEYWEDFSDISQHELGFLYGISGIGFSFLHLCKE